MDASQGFPEHDVVMLADVSSGVHMTGQLQVAILWLQDTVALATSVDELAHFSGDPEEESWSYGDPWEMINKALNVLICFG
jgi:hypothetical protein